MRERGNPWKNFTELHVVPPNETQKIADAFSEALKGKTGCAKFKIVDSNGKARQIESSLSIVKFGDKISGVLVVARDVTEREQM